MPFHFSLQAVLRLRTSYEQMEKLRFLAAAAAVVRAREEIAALEEETRAARQSQQGRLGKGVLAGELHFAVSSEGVRVQRKRAMAARLAELEKKQEAQRQAYQAARQKREILENLRQRKWDDYRREQARREQQQVDESFLLHLAAGSGHKPE
ncbi:MAG: flagellar export protein FliJ [Candidatus Acidiferrales bacterium]|jgi:flagellar FliJ protein